MKKLLLPLLFLLALTCPSFAEDEEVTANADDAVIEEEQQPSVSPVPSNIMATPEFKAVQADVMNSPDILKDIQKLLDDPEVMAMMSDPNFLAAIQSGNTAALQSDPNLKRLSENPKIQALIEKIKSQQ